MTKKKCSVYSHSKHKKILKKSKGYYGSRSKCYKISKQSVIKAGQYSYIDRKIKKRNIRKLWILRINSAVRKYNMNYSSFINILKKKSIFINRKILSIISSNKDQFEKLLSKINFK
ncbi:50S ribosomal protein L20 [endosymbiont of Pachyrhynchus infernalis]|uniref:50S ribosomal protein L20 n=1 Tax=endosymbiont of Pachyrhynchus infernalis TaxID=1971488 RepID=UPI000DC6F903|nr:50S ribosomal protein L20 [endosymbiont of Pachyrhynchus infernalis]BBA84865.1 50S ribosomal protein L20 [endosymbiont of Pachyrhynchus infernalis]